MRQTIIDNLYTFINQRPGLEPGNYDREGYLYDSRQITKDLHDARVLLTSIRWRDSIDAEALINAARHSWSGRLEIKPNGSIDYCTGQYWPTEYRKSVCATLASALRAYWRADGVSDIRTKARKELGRGVASRWFN